MKQSKLKSHENKAKNIWKDTSVKVLRCKASNKE